MVDSPGVIIGQDTRQRSCGLCSCNESCHLSATFLHQNWIWKLRPVKNNPIAPVLPRGVYFVYLKILDQEKCNAKNFRSDRIRYLKNKNAIFKGKFHIISFGYENWSKKPSPPARPNLGGFRQNFVARDGTRSDFYWLWDRLWASQKWLSSLYFGLKSPSFLARPMITSRISGFVNGYFGSDIWNIWKISMFMIFLNFQKLKFSICTQFKKFRISEKSDINKHQ